MRLKSMALIKKMPKPQKVLKISVGIFILFVLFVSLTPWWQNAIGTGRVIAYSPTERQYTVNAPITGRIDKWFVNEGDHVIKGDHIVKMSDLDPNLITRLQKQKAAIQLKLKAAKAAVAAALSNEKRQKQLYEEGINARRQYELAKIERTRHQLAIAEANVELNKIDTELARQASQLISAQSNGFIFRRLTGQESVVVQQGTILAEILPETQSRAVEIFIDGNDIPFVRLNQKARLEFEGWPAVQFRGWPEIAYGTFAGKVAFIDATDNGKGQFRVVITPDEKWPSNNYLRQGVRVQGWILLGKVPLWYELWRQFNGFPPESAGDEK